MKLCCATVLALLLMNTAAHADETPWSKGVAVEKQTEARKLLDDGNELFLKKQYREALAIYRQALLAWNHPAIRFNLVRALLSLDEPVEASANLTEAMQYGAAALGDTMYAEAINYQNLLKNLVAAVEIQCDPAATVTLDGDPISCPSQMLKVRPGRHVIAAQRKGFLSVARTETIVGGDNPPIRLSMVSIVDAAVTKTRWATWKPWVVVGAGAATLAVGTLTEISARSTRDEYGAALLRECRDTACSDLATTKPEIAALKDSYEFRHQVGLATVVTGGAALGVGAVLLFMNRPITFTKSEAPIAVLPTSHGLAIFANGSF